MLRLIPSRIRLLWRVFSLVAVAFALAVLSADDGKARKSGHAVRLIVDGPIGPAVADYIHRGLEKAVEGGATVVILQMDTPGGLDTSMREIIKDILASPVPVIGYVGCRHAGADGRRRRGKIGRKTGQGQG
jgi:membrane-bound serine protease (ClpP class)